MSSFEHGGDKLARVHARANDKKYFCYFTGFLEGIAASGALEVGEIRPFIDQSEEFAKNTNDEDAIEFLRDFEVDLLEHVSIVDAVGYRAADIDVQCSKSSLNRFMGYCAGIACDDLITLEEAEGIIGYKASNPSLVEDNVAASIIFCCEDAVVDGVIDSLESKNICNSITSLVGDCYADTGISALGAVPLFPEGNFPSDFTEVDGAVVVFTGNFEVVPRKVLEDELAEFGGKRCAVHTGLT